MDLFRDHVWLQLPGDEGMGALVSAGARRDRNLTIQIITGDCVERLADIPAASVQTVVTSPPYYGLRSYLPPGHPDKAREIGQERRPFDYVSNLVTVFREVRRTMKPDGTLWLNIGDTYGNGKQLLMLPARVAIALQDDGWILRQQVAWIKPAPMPENVKDRPSSAWEPVFMLTQSEGYFYDQDAMREPAVTTARQAKTKWAGRREERDKGQREGVYHGGGKPFVSDPHPLGRNGRNVWTVSAQQPFPGAHFAIMPIGVAENCIKASTRPGDMVLDPFGGSGTTALMADRLNRNATLIEINPDFAALTERRLRDSNPLFMDTRTA
jgi:DNA modification methylase